MTVVSVRAMFEQAYGLPHDSDPRREVRGRLAWLAVRARIADEIAHSVALGIAPARHDGQLWQRVGDLVVGRTQRAVWPH